MVSVYYDFLKLGYNFNIFFDNVLVFFGSRFEIRIGVFGLFGGILVG